MSEGMEAAADPAGAPDLLSFTPLRATSQRDDAASFVCSSSSGSGRGGLSITAQAVYLGVDDDVLRIAIADIRSWRSAAVGSLFSLTVSSDAAHVTHLFSRFRRATVSAMTLAYGPEDVLLMRAV